jgi:hypothetical protein
MMTGLQELQDEILGLEAALAGKRMELAQGQGEKETARQHQHAMYASIQQRRAFRVAVSDQDGECFFDAAGQADKLALQGIKK